ncbi:MAG: hypothetical protein Ct9H300mP31_03980 [Acidimicrobiaceae bacterium]|nr:MAG: hypothetical protein Ct9H300mP31_03980 [Acidimicrobiaceae bacterium]
MEPTTATDLALLVLRVVVGLTLAGHGWNKFTGGGKIPGTGRWFDSMDASGAAQRLFGRFHRGGCRPVLAVGC